MSQTGMKQRCWEHDYCAPSFYMLTIVTEPRRSCLSSLAPGAGTALCTEPNDSLKISPIGAIVQDAWRRTSTIYPGVEACECVVMPDHFHGLLWVKEKQERHMGHIVKAFKLVSTRECRSKGLLLARDQAGLVKGAAPAACSQSLWQEGFQDSILLRRGQLKAMSNYIADNPRRLAAKRANPELFTVVATQHVGEGRSCPAIGNRFLLDHPLKRQVQISRSISPEALAEKKAELLYAAEHGTVLVSPCISPGEKEIARAALDAGLPLIVLMANGFAPLYKPPGRYFDACAAAHLLMLAPFPYQREKQTITREQCLALNEWAEAAAHSDIRM
jgi:REP element-mobilizing transposase RayT